MTENAQPQAVGWRRGFQRNRARWGNLVVFGLIAAALFGSLALIFTTVEAERAQREQAADTREVVAELRAINRAVLNAETGQRGYMITLDRRYLGSYLVGREQYQPALERLSGLLRPDATPRQKVLVERIENLADAKFAEMAESVETLDQGDPIEARRRMLSDEGQEVMERLRVSLREMEEIEQGMLDQAETEAAVAEGRVMPLLAILFTLLLIALAFGFRLAARAARAEAEAAQAAALAEARDRADLLARELNHRVKNLFAVILAIVRMSGKDSPEAGPLIDRIADRIRALLTAHEVTQGALDKAVASFGTLLETTLAPYRSDSMPVELTGPDVLLPARQITPLGLVLHELTTNAVKYGCWSSGGRLEVEWRTADEELVVDWREVCETSGGASEHEGFGSMLMTSAARQLRGTIEREFTPNGARVAIRIPLDAPAEPG